MFVPSDITAGTLAANAPLDVVVVVAARNDPDPCAPLRMLSDLGLARRTVVIAAGDDRRTATESMSMGIGAYVVRGTGVERMAAAIVQVAGGGAYFDEPAAAMLAGRDVTTVDRTSAARALANALELKDTYTGGHAERVAALAMRLATAARLPGAEPSDALEVAFLLHDVGKIGIPESILGKPGALTETERRVLQTHPILGERVVAPLGLPDCVRQVVRYHHERWDGRGYPDGLAGEDIPAAARIFSIADVLDAMTSFRPYRSPLSMEEGVHEVLLNAGGQFDPMLAALTEEVFLQDTVDLVAETRLGDR